MGSPSFTTERATVPRWNGWVASLSVELMSPEKIGGEPKVMHERRVLVKSRNGSGQPKD